MSDIVEWLREMQDEYAPGGGGVQYHENYKAAADRIGALEEALREIAALSMVDICSWDAGFYKARGIARRALGEGKP